MATETLQPGENGTEPGGSIGVTPKMSLSDKQQKHRQQLVHCNAANVATKNITKDSHLKIICKTERSKNINQHTIGCEHINVMVIDG
jgi:hypothetical protein